MAKKNAITPLVNFFYEIGVMRSIMRSYHIHVRADTESLAEHNYRVAIIAYFLAKELGADEHKTLIMALFHDLAETRTGDSEWVQKRYIKQNEDLALYNQLKPLGKNSKDISKLVKEYQERKTLESQIAKDADNIDYILSLRELELTGNREAHRRLNSEDTSPDILYTDLARDIVKLAKETDPTEWTREELLFSFEKYSKHLEEKKGRKKTAKTGKP